MGSCECVCPRDGGSECVCPRNAWAAANVCVPATVGERTMRLVGSSPSGYRRGRFADGQLRRYTAIDGRCRVGMGWPWPGLKVVRW
jgi:hypothetical protein